MKMWEHKPREGVLLPSRNTPNTLADILISSWLDLSGLVCFAKTWVSVVYREVSMATTAFSFSWRRFYKVLDVCRRSVTHRRTDMPLVHVGAHPWCKSHVPPHPWAALLDGDLVTVEAIWAHWTNYHVSRNHFENFECWDMTCRSAVTRWVQGSHEGQHMLSNSTEEGCDI